MGGWLLAGTTFLATAVEAVEALTVVLAVGYTRSWRSAISGAGWGIVALLTIVAVLGPAIVTFVPLASLRVAVGVILLLFGLAWLRKAILRSSGRKALHDEDAIYERHVATLAGPVDKGGMDRVGFATSFNAVLLEGLEVAIIVLTVGSAVSDGFLWSGGGAVTAVLVVSGAGYAVRKPFGRVPENAMKFAVGLLLTSFGTLWTGEGLGIPWWHGDLSLLWIVAAFAVASFVTIRFARRPSSFLDRGTS